MMLSMSACSSVAKANKKGGALQPASLPRLARLRPPSAREGLNTSAAKCLRERRNRRHVGRKSFLLGLDRLLCCCVALARFVCLPCSIASLLRRYIPFPGLIRLLCGLTTFPYSDVRLLFGGGFLSSGAVLSCGCGLSCGGTTICGVFHGGGSIPEQQRTRSRMPSWATIRL